MDGTTLVRGKGTNSSGSVSESSLEEFDCGDTNRILRRVFMDKIYSSVTRGE